MPAARGQIQVEAKAVSQAPPATVFALLKDGPNWPKWSSFTGFELERPGLSDPLGLGAIRVNKTPVTTAREEVIGLVADRKFSYVLLSGMPMLNYRADVELAPSQGRGTEITWRATFDPKYPGTGWFWRLFMSQVLATLTRQLARAATRVSSGT